MLNDRKRNMPSKLAAMIKSEKVVYVANEDRVRRQQIPAKSLCRYLLMQRNTQDNYHKETRRNKYVNNYILQNKPLQSKCASVSIRQM